MSKEKVLTPNFDMRIVIENVARLGISKPNSQRIGKRLVIHQETVSKLPLSKKTIMQPSVNLLINSRRNKSVNH